MEPLEYVPGSFRDPGSRVFLHEGRVFRGVDETSRATLHDLAGRGLLRSLIADGLLIDAEPVEDGELQKTFAAAHPDFRHFLRHPTVPMLSWPYEWTISMLADAGLRTLELQLRLLAASYSLKDASAYNVQFIGCRPTFIDLGSIERPRRLDVWFALGQFSQMFTFPLLLCRGAGWDLRSYFLANLGGLSAERVAAVMGRGAWLRPGLIWDVMLPALLTRWAHRRWSKQTGSGPARDKAGPDLAGSPPEGVSGPMPQGSPASQVLNLKRLQRKIARLTAGYRPRGVWSDYVQTCSYRDAAQQAKLAMVERFLAESRPQRVLDLGCNTGEYSRLAARCGAEVVAVDSDHDAVEVLYRGLRENPAPITPMVVDLCQPSPAIGFMNCERAAWLDRATSDCVLALALLHHLMVAGNLSLEAVRDLLFRLSRRDVILEFVPTDDEQFRRLMQFRVDLYGGLTLDSCRKVFCERFQLLAEQAIPGTRRTLQFFRKAGNSP